MSELKQTDLSKRLRELAQRLVTPYETAKVMLDAAEEIERYYTGMLNWKATAEAQSRAQPEANADAKDAEHKEPTHDNHPGHHDGMTCKQASQWLTDYNECLLRGLTMEPIEVIKATIEADRVDAERYRYLRDEAWKRKPDLHDGGRAALMIGNHGEQLDTAIDAARQAKEKGNV